MATPSLANGCATSVQRPGWGSKDISAWQATPLKLPQLVGKEVGFCQCPDRNSGACDLPGCGLAPHRRVAQGQAKLALRFGGFSGGVICPAFLAPQGGQGWREMQGLPWQSP